MQSKSRGACCQNVSADLGRLAPLAGAAQAQRQQAQASTLSIWQVGHQARCLGLRALQHGGKRSR